MPPHLRPGEYIKKRYLILRMIGRGAHAILYAAWDTKILRHVALKFPLDQSDLGIKRLRHEVGVAQFLKHPNVCEAIQVDETAHGLKFAVMEYVDGENLRSILDRYKLRRRTAERLAIELCAGVNQMHAVSLVHRDLKPENIMLDRSSKVKITDLGVAEPEGLGGGGIAGTYEYMAPEQTHFAPADRRSDIYSIGLVLYEAFTDVQCLKRDSYADRDASLSDSERMMRHLEAIRQSQAALTRPPSEINTDLDASIDRLIMTCLQIDPAARRDADYFRNQWTALAQM